jgi:hypothetical protein
MTQTEHIGEKKNEYTGIPLYPQIQDLQFTTARKKKNLEI